MPFAPVINTTRVVKKGGLRGSSVPPIHLGANVSRTRGSTAASSRGVSIARPSVAGHASSVGSHHRPVSIALHSTSGTSLTPFVSVSGYHPKPVARRASIAVPGGSNFTFWRVGSSKPSGLSSGLPEVTKSTTTARSVYRPSSHAAFGRSAAVVKSEGDFARSSSSTRVPQTGRARSSLSGTATQATRGFLSPGFPNETSRSRPVYRSASSFALGWDADEEYTGAPVFHRAPTLRGSYSTKVSQQKTSQLPDNEKATSKVVNIKSYDFPSQYQEKTVDNDVHRKKIVDYELEMERIVPVHQESLSKLRTRALQAKDHLSQHKVLIDRYLPLHLGPESDVVGAVESRYGELVARMPNLEPRRKSRDENVTYIEPYKPAAVNKAPKLAYDIANTPVKSNFTPKISDTRKRARNVLCKIKGDPNYFTFS